MIHDEIWDTIIDAARKYKGILEVISFVVDFAEKVISFYVIPDRSSKNAKKEIKAFKEELKSLFPDMRMEILEGLEN